MDVIANMATALHTTVDYLLGQDTEHDETFDFAGIKRILARNAANMTAEEKNALISAILSEKI